MNIEEINRRIEELPKGYISKKNIRGRSASIDNGKRTVRLRVSISRTVILIL